MMYSAFFHLTQIGLSVREISNRIKDHFNIDYPSIKHDQNRVALNREEMNQNDLRGCLVKNKLVA